MNGRHPARLILGQSEADSFRKYFETSFGESLPRGLVDTYFLGLKVVESDSPHELTFEGEKIHPHTEDDLPPIGNNTSHTDVQANATGVASELDFQDQWDTAALRQLIDEKTQAGRKPAFLFLGKAEAALLREHLGAAFGPESVQSLKNLYYMGLEVIELKTQSFLRTAGMKRIRDFHARNGHHPKWKDITNGSVWQLEFL